MTLRERIKELCIENGTSLNKLEIACGFGKGYISKLDKSKPNSENLQKIANYFGISVDYLMTGKVPTVEENFGTEYAKLIRKIRNDVNLSNALLKYFTLSEKQKAYIIETINFLSKEN